MADQRMSRRRPDARGAGWEARPRRSPGPAPPPRTCRRNGPRSWPGPRRRARSSSTPSRATATSGRSRPSPRRIPDIKLEHTGLHSQDFAPRIMQERQASLYTWDVATIPTSTALQVLRPAGVWDPDPAGHRPARGQGRRGLGGRLRARLRAGEGPRARLRLRRHARRGHHRQHRPGEGRADQGSHRPAESRSGRASCCCPTCARWATRSGR